MAWIADDGGHLEEAGVDAEVQVMGGSAATMRSLIAGSTDVGLAGGDAVVKANMAGADLVVVAGLVDRFYHRLIVRPEIEKPEDLRGKKIGLAFLGGPQDMAVKHALKGMGLRYGEDVEVLNMGREFNRMAALSRGDIHGTTSQTPPGRLKALGFRVLADLPAEDVRFPYAVVVVRRATLESRRGQVQATLRGLCAAIAHYKAERDGSLAIIGRHIQGADTEEAARERYDVSGPHLLSWPPVPSEEGFQTVIDALADPKARGVRPADLFDLSLLEGLRRQGHCGGEGRP